MPEHVRPVHRETRFGKLRSLKCFDEVHRRICEGWGITDVARFIQDEQQEYVEITHDSLVQALKDYRASIPPALRAARTLPKAITAAVEEVTKGMDELTALEDLYAIQRQRIDIDGEVEKKIGKLIPTMTQEIRVAREILQSYADLKMDLGLSKRHLGQLDVDAKVVADVTGRYGKASVEKVMKSPESRRKVLGIAEKILQLAAKRGVEGPKAAEATIEVEPAPADPVAEAIDVTPAVEETHS